MDSELITFIGRGVIEDCCEAEWVGEFGNKYFDGSKEVYHSSTLFLCNASRKFNIKGTDR